MRCNPCFSIFRAWRPIRFLEGFQGICRGKIRYISASCLDPGQKTLRQSGLRDFRTSPVAACIRPVLAPESGVMSEKTTGFGHGLTNYGDRDFSLYLRRSFAQSMGYSRAMLAKPVVGIAYTPSGFNNCHRHFPELLDAVKRGVLAAGALPVEFPHHLARRSVPQPDQHEIPQPDVDGHRGDDPRPADGRGGADGRLRQDRAGAAHGRGVGRPAGDHAGGGPMMTGRHRGERLGACTDCRRFWAQYRAGKVDDEEISEVEGRLATTAGTCAVMGTASTMACIAEALGMILPGTAAIPAVHADRLRAAEATGAAAVRLIGSEAHARAHRQREVGGERAARAARARRLDQCGHSSHRDRRPRRRAGVAQAAQ